MYKYIVVSLISILYSTHLYSGAFCVCGDGTSRGDKQPISCSGKCPTGCQRATDPNEDDFRVTGCPSDRSRITLCSISGCVEEILISKTGYPDGHKTWWCRSVGFDGVRKDSLGNDVCFRECSNKDKWVDAQGCYKKAMGCLGYSEGNKGQFCKAKGFDGAFNHRAKIDGWDKLNFGDQQVLEPGYCYTGNSKVCTWETPKQPEPKPPLKLRGPSVDPHYFDKI